jgi:hypothetical protein
MAAVRAMPPSPGSRARRGRRPPSRRPVGDGECRRDLGAQVTRPVHAVRLNTTEQPRVPATLAGSERRGQPSGW